MNKLHENTNKKTSDVVYIQQQQNPSLYNTQSIRSRERDKTIQLKKAREKKQDKLSNNS
jgi:hypothetical protein